MNNPFLKKALPHLIAIGVALLIIIAYFNPLLSGKVLRQTDVDQWRASYEEIRKFETTTGERTFWTGTSFSGMPSYLIGASYYYNTTAAVLFYYSQFIPNPVNTVLLLFICFYILMLTFELSPLLAFIGAIAFTFSSFNFVNIDAGHMTKGNAIALMPLVLAGIRITLYKNRLMGAIVTGIGMSMQLAANHLQITYYLTYIIAAWMIVEIVIAIKQKRIAHLFVCGSFLAIAALLGVGTYAPGLMATREYGEYSIRGAGELTKTATGEDASENASSGLDKDYALQYSYQPLEPLTIIFPDIYGGGMYGELSTSSQTYEILKQNGVPNAKQIIQTMPLYWGSQPFTAGPTYYGAIICFLFVLGLILVKGPEKWWILAVSLLALFLSMGRFFPALTDFFFYHVPLYNKFRSVTFVLCITQLTFPLLGLLAVKEIVSGNISKQHIQKSVLLSTYIVGGLCLVFALAPGLLFSVFGVDVTEGTDQHFASRADAQFPEWLRDALVNDRKSLLRMNAIRALVLIGLSVGAIWLYLKGTLKVLHLGIILGVLIVADLWQVDSRYLNKSDYQAKKKKDQPVFAKTQVDEFILQDTDPNFRVFNTTQNLTQDAITSYYHKSIGGYHGAKLRRYQDLIEFQMSKNNMEVFNMLNVKYFILGDSSNNLFPQRNPEACGHAWFVPSYVMVENADAEMDSLNAFKPKQKAFIDKRFADQLAGFTPQYDSTASIKLLSYAPNKLVYETDAKQNQLAVFSEIFYEKGWNAYVDGQLTPYLRCDYVLRGMKVPAGKHEIVFKFEPQVVAVGERISMISSILLYGGLMVIGLLVYLKRRKSANA